jgi:hypothetical protein
MAQSAAVTATTGDAIRVLPTALAYHFTLPHMIDFLPEVTESLGMKVELKNDKTALETFQDYIKGDLKYEHIDDPEQRHMNDWLTAWITLNTCWPYIPILGIYKGFKLGADMVKNGDDGQRWIAGIISLFLSAPMNVVMGLYEATNYTSARIREQGLDKAMLEVYNKVPQVVSAAFDENDKKHNASAFASGASTGVVNVLLTPFMPLMGTYGVTKMIGDMTHRDRPTQFVAMLLGAPLLATLGLPYFALVQSNEVARKMTHDGKISNWASKFLDDISNGMRSIGKA